MVNPTSSARALLLPAASLAFLFSSAVGPRIMLDPVDRPGGGGTMVSSLKALLEKRSKLRADMGAIITKAEAEDRDLTAEESAAFDALKAQVSALDPRIARLEEQSGAEAALGASRGAVARSPQLATTRRGPEARTEFENIGEFLHAVRFNRNDQRLNFVEGVGHAEAGEDGMRAEMRTDDGASGGFMLPPQFRNTLLQLPPGTAVVRPRATVIEPGTPPDGPVTMPALDQTGAAPNNMFGGVAVQWIGEGATKPRTDMKLREVTLTPHEVAGTMLITDKLLRNWPAASSLIETQLRNAIALAEDLAFLAGNGVGKPLGILKAGATFKVNRLVAGQVSYLDLIAIESRCDGDFEWVYSKSVLPQLRQLKNPSGQYIWSDSAVASQPSTLLGRPARPSDRCAVLGGYGDIFAADFSKYLIKDGSGPFVAASEHVYFEQNKTVIKAFWNVDGSPWLTTPYAKENGWIESPFVALDVPAP